MNRVETFADGPRMEIEVDGVLTWRPCHMERDRRYNIEIYLPELRDGEHLLQVLGGPMRISTGLSSR